MRGKRDWRASASPPYEHVVWEEKKTGRGTKVMGKVVATLRTLKAKKLPLSQSKRRKLQSPTTLEEPLVGAEPIPINFPETKKRSGKVCIAA